MERIKHALGKARTESNLFPMDAKESPEVTSPSVTEAIVYRHTRKVDLAPAVTKEKRITAFDRDNQQGKVFDILRTKVLQKMDENGWRTVAITSATPGSGKTVVAINLAIAIAQKIDRTAMLVDFDFRRPKIARYLGLSPEVSLNEVVRGRASVSAALINPGIPGLVLMPTLQPEMSSAELLSSPRMIALIGEMRDRYVNRTIIFDLPPLLGVDDAMSVLPHIDCALLVIAEGESTSEEVEESLRRLSPTHLLGTVLNKGEITNRKHY